MHPTASAAIAVLPVVLAAGCKGSTAITAPPPSASSGASAVGGSPERPDGGGAPRETESGEPKGATPVIRAPLPSDLLRSVLGCWRLEDREQWTITRTAEGGAEVVRTLLHPESAGGGPDFLARAATPTALMYDEARSTLAFTTAGPVHALLFAFTVTPKGLEGSWASSRAPGKGYEPTGETATLTRCIDAARPDGGDAAR